MNMIRMGLVLTDAYVAAAFAEKGRIIHHSTSPSSGDPLRDIESGLSQVESEVRKFRHRISSISIVTDATRYVVMHASDLDKVALFRFSSPEGRDSPTLLNQDLADVVLHNVFVISGGHGFDGRIIGTPDSHEVEECYNKSKRLTNNFVISSPFSILYPDHEQLGAAELSRLGARRIWTSTDVSSKTSMLDRETTALLSACTSSIIERLSAGTLSKLKQLGCKPAVYFGRNDGTVIGAELGKRFPLDTAWSVEGHSAAGASRLERLSGCLVAGKSEGETWIAGIRKGRPIIQTISYLNNMLVHVLSPVLARFSESTPREVKTSRFEMISQLTGTKKILAADSTANWDVPFAIKGTKKSSTYAAINAACAAIELDWASNLPKGTDLRNAEMNLRKTLGARMKQAGAQICTFGHLVSRPGINLPEGTTTLTLQGRGNAV